MGAFNWSLLRDLYLAKSGANVHHGGPSGPAEVAQLERLLAESQRVCAHSPNPEAPHKCWRCDAPVAALEARPTLAKALPRAVEGKKRYVVR
jgi:hypothetical protein